MNDSVRYRMELDILHDGIKSLAVKYNFHEKYVRCIDQLLELVLMSRKMQILFSTIHYAGDKPLIPQVFGFLLSKILAQAPFDF